MTCQAFRACPVCEALCVEPLHTQRFVLPLNHPLSEGYDVVECVACGFVYADVRAAQVDYDRFYAELSKYDDAATSTGAGESPYDRARLAESARLIEEITGNRGARVLDIGCAGGGLLSALADRGFRNLVGVDPSPQCARQTRERIGEAYAGWVTSMPSGIGRFDCIVLSHVMEHVLDVPAAIAAFRTLLSEAGRVWIEVPDAARYAAHIYAPFQDFNTEHINHFSAASLDQAMELRGYRALGGGERLLHSSAHTFTPAVYRAFSWDGECRAVEPDSRLGPAIRRYIERSALLMRRIEESIAAALAESDEVVVWGAGQLALKLLAETSLGRARIAAFVDSNPVHQRKQLAGAPIVAPAEAHAYMQPILVATMLHHREISEQIQMLGLQNPVVLLPEGGPAFFGDTE